MLGLDFRKGAGRPGPLLPPSAGRETAVGFVIAVLAFLAAIAILSAIAANRAASGWQAEVLGSASVLVRPSGGESPDAAAARAAEALAGAPGVDEAAMLTREEAEALLRPWLGRDVLADLPIPRLVAVELSKESPATAAALEKALADARVDADVDDHSLWTRQIVRAGNTARIVAAASALLLILAVAAVVAVATGAALERWRTAIQVLHFAGAEDRFVAGLVMRRFAVQALAASLVGGGAAAALGAITLAAAGKGGLLPSAPLVWGDLAFILAVPLAALIAGAVVSSRSALRVLRTWP